MDEIKNWQNMFRWIVKLIRDEYGVEESILTRTASLEEDLGLSLEQVELIIEHVGDKFTINFPDGALNEVLKLEELCLLASWLHGLYKQPPFISDDFAEACKESNSRAE